MHHDNAPELPGVRHAEDPVEHRPARVVGAPRLFVEHAAAVVRGKGGRIANADITLICEAPKIGPHRADMTAALADMLKIDAGRISVKATTNEKLGFIGREEGIAAIATASVIFAGDVPA